MFKKIVLAIGVFFVGMGFTQPTTLFSCTVNGYDHNGLVENEIECRNYKNNEYIDGVWLIYNPYETGYHVLLKMDKSSRDSINQFFDTFSKWNVHAIQNRMFDVTKDIGTVRKVKTIILDENTNQTYNGTVDIRFQFGTFLSQNKIHATIMVFFEGYDFEGDYVKIPFMSLQTMMALEMGAHFKNINKYLAENLKKEKMAEQLQR
jgi:hypothetical protein